jgi:L-2-hydroxyglutarate oxidase LhgO
VVHAGIYYRPDSLKAKMCVRGRDLLYRYASERGIPHKRCGKLIVATDCAQHDQLDAIHRAAAANGVSNLEYLSVESVAELEPEVYCTRALLSPSTGVVDSHSLMLGFHGDIEDNGGAVVLQSPVLSADSATAAGGGLTVVVGGATPMSLACDAVINTAGLSGPQLATMMNVGLPPPPVAQYAKGNYYSLCGSAPFDRLVYPVPEPGTAGLGVHATVDLGGRTRFGPDVQWLSQADAAQVRVDHFPEHVYDVDLSRADAFYAAIRRYWPGLLDGQLQADYSGVRPKLTGPTDLVAADFRVDVTHSTRRPGCGWGGSVALYGIESPGLTASLALAEHVCNSLDA